ncbi:MAG TPA: serine hydrolase domain-containing protein [Chitinophagaceae bacterium]|nr:serine hydrolase domain-containing protein [Chitinophagaceae bacterium]
MKTTLLLLIPLYILKTCNTSSNGSSTPEIDTSAASSHSHSTLSASEIAAYSQAAAAFYEKALDKPSFNGAFLVAKNGQIVYEKYRGYFDIKKKDSLLNEASAFHIASISKTFTAMATLKLWELGKLSLDDDLSKYFPSFPYEGVTIKMLMNHRSGLPNYVHYFDKYKWDKRKYVSNQDVLQSLYDYKPGLQYPVGKRFSYCNTNYALLALIIEKVSGMSYADFLQSNFFNPLNMNDTYVFSMADTARAMPSYEYNGRKFDLEFLDLVYGDKNIYSTPRDLLKWDQAMYPGSGFLKAATLDSAYTPYSFEKPGIKNYGLGWRMFVYPNGKKIIYHNGWWHGNNTVMTRLMQDSATIIVLGSKRNNNIYRVKPLFEVFSHYNGKEELDQ